MRDLSTCFYDRLSVDEMSQAMRTASEVTPKHRHAKSLYETHHKASKIVVLERNMTTILSFAQLEDTPLLEAAKRLAREERHATAALLRALMEIDTRRLYPGQGCASMFTYCTKVLH